MIVTYLSVNLTALINGIPENAVGIYPDIFFSEGEQGNFCGLKEQIWNNIHIVK